MTADRFDFRPLPALAEARSAYGGNQVRLLRKAGEALREQLLSFGPVQAVETRKLVTFPYPTGYAFSGAALSPAPYIMMTNRMQVVQYKDHGGAVRTLLLNPTDYQRGQKAPFFANLRKRYGDFISDKVMSTRHGTVTGHLETLGLKPEDVDFIAFDHLHVQDVRGWLGGAEPAYFPRARLLVQRAEWEATKDLHPMQWAWYCPDGTKDVPEERVVLLDGDTWLGQGVALLSTPGHTYGNMSFAVVTPRGVAVISENGVATESYSPLQSRIPGLRSTAEHTGLEVMLNGNTRESSLEQYSSMILEKAVAGPSRDDGSYVNFYPSSELTASVIAPGLAPTFSLGDLSHGDLRRPDSVARAA